MSIGTLTKMLAVAIDYNFLSAVDSLLKNKTHFARSVLLWWAVNIKQ